MISVLLKSTLAGAVLGIIYGLLFAHRIKKFFFIEQQAEHPAPKRFFRGARGLANILLFLSSYALIGFLLYIFITIVKIDLLVSTLFFFITFWFIVWRYAGK